MRTWIKILAGIIGTYWLVPLVMLCVTDYTPTKMTAGVAFVGAAVANFTIVMLVPNKRKGESTKDET